MQQDWTADGLPPEDAYGRVTNPERFAPLHQVAAGVLDELEQDFEVERRQGYALDPELEGRCDMARPSVMLVPADPGAAPLVVAFTEFPGIRARFGHWCTPSFPTCGCDACAETAEEEEERFRSMVEDVTAGRFRETIEIRPETGKPAVMHEFWSDRGGSSGGSLVDEERAAQLAAGGPAAYEWRPWPRRAHRAQHPRS